MHTPCSVLTKKQFSLDKETERGYKKDLKDKIKLHDKNIIYEKTFKKFWVTEKIKTVNICQFMSY